MLSPPCRRLIFPYRCAPIRSAPRHGTATVHWGRVLSKPLAALLFSCALLVQPMLLCMVGTTLPSALVAAKSPQGCTNLDDVLDEKWGVGLEVQESHWQRCCRSECWECRRASGLVHCDFVPVASASAFRRYGLCVATLGRSSLGGGAIFVSFGWAVAAAFHLASLGRGHETIFDPLTDLDWQSITKVTTSGP